MADSTRINFLYPNSLMVVAMVVWTLLYQAQFLEYDENYGNILAAFFLSLGSTAALIFLLFKRRALVGLFRWQTIVFLVFSSPLTIALVYELQGIFWVTLKN
jgi:hypothetical protein